MDGQYAHFVVAMLVIAVTGCSGQQIPVTVYYESLCPDSQAFITNQLYPVMQTPLGKLVALQLVPFGKSNFSTQGSDVLFTCHHGPNECFGNRVQACAIEHIQVDSFQSADTRESKTLDYVNCLMKAGNNFADSVYPGKKCSHELQLKNWERIDQCANATEGANLLQRYGERTLSLKPMLTSVPTITFRHQYDEKNQALALTNFRSAVCKQFSAPLPKECQNTNAAGSLNIFSASALLAIVATVLASANRA